MKGKKETAVKNNDVFYNFFFMNTPTPTRRKKIPYDNDTIIVLPLCPALLFYVVSRLTEPKDDDEGELFFC